MNNTNSQKYGFPPEAVEKKALSDNIFREIYDFHRIVRVSKDAARYKRYDIRIDKKLNSRRKQVREPFTIGERVLVLAERLKKRMHQAVYLKAQPKTFHFLIEMKFS